MLINLQVCSVLTLWLINLKLDTIDTVCLYSYHWGSTHIDLITRRNGDTVVPIKNVYGRVVPGLTRNAVSNRISKLGSKTVALSEPYVNVLKKLQLPITARSHYLTISDFIQICIYYRRSPPSNLTEFAQITSCANPAEILKKFNTQTPALVLPILTLPYQVMGDSPDNQSDFSNLSPEKFTNLVTGLGEQYTPYEDNSWSSRSFGKEKYDNYVIIFDIDPSIVRSLHFSDGMKLSVIQQGAQFYMLNTELPTIFPQVNQSVIGQLRSLLNIPLEYASRSIFYY